ncbi:unnamed protein product [Aphanomyces euteiches]
MASFELTESKFTNRRNQSIYTRQYIPAGNTFKVVYVFLHGIGEHSTRFDPFFRTVAAQNIAVYALDHHGHGKSDGDRCDCNLFEDFIDDINDFVTTIHASHADRPSLKYVISGISFGGLLAAHTAACGLHEWDGVVLAAPAIGIDFTPIVGVQQYFAPTLSYLMPTAAIVPAVQSHLLSRDPAFIKDYDADPLNAHGNLKMRMAAEMSKGMQTLTAIQGNLKMPIFIMHGDADQVTSPKVSKAFFDALSSQHKTYASRPRQFHCLFNEPEKDDNIRLVLDWIQGLDALPDLTALRLHPKTAFDLSESSFVNDRNQKLYTRQYIPKASYDRVLLFLHGVGEHCSRFHGLFSIVASQGIAVYALDHHGHGKSDGDRHDCRTFDEYLPDINLYTEKIHDQHKNKDVKYFLCGFSFGGLIAAHLAARQANQWDGIVLAAPAIGLDLSLSLKVQMILADILVAVAPTAAIVAGVDTNLISRNKAIVHDFEADPLNSHGLMKMRMGYAITQGQKDLVPLYSNVKSPILIIHGQADGITSSNVSKKFFNEIPSTNKTFLAVPDSYHAVFDEPERHEHIRTLVDWIQNPRVLTTADNLDQLETPPTINVVRLRHVFVGSFVQCVLLASLKVRRGLIMTPKSHGDNEEIQFDNPDARLELANDVHDSTQRRRHRLATAGKTRTGRNHFSISTPTNMASFELVESSFVNERNQHIYTRQYIPTGDTFKLVYIFLHGVGEHCTRFDPYFRTVAEQNIAVYALDHHGHGKSEGRRHDCNLFEDFVDDINAFVEIIRTKLVDRPCLKYVISGISFGGLLAAHTAACGEHPWDGVVLAAPAIGLDFTPIVGLQQYFATALSAVVPTAAIVPAVKSELLSRDGDFVKDYDSDPLNAHGNLKMRLAAEISKGMKTLEPIQSHISVPILILHGDADKVTSPTVSRAFFDALPSQHKTYESRPGQFHCLFNEPEKAGNMSIILDWLNELHQRPDLTARRLYPQTTFTFSESSFVNGRDQTIYTRQYIPSSSYNRVLLFLHGLGEHCSRYDSMFATLASQGIAVYTMDHHGHGKSDGERHDCNVFEDFVLDINQFAMEIRDQHADTNCFYFVGGISFGGLLAAHVAASGIHPWDGVVLAAPAIGLDYTPIVAMEVYFAEALSSVVPTAAIVPAVDINMLSRNKSFIHHAEADPLNAHGKLKMRLAADIAKGMKSLEILKKNVTMPIVIFHGDADVVTSPTVSKKFYEEIPSTNKSYVSLAGNYHNIFAEPEKDETIRSFVEWVKNPRVLLEVTP